MADDDNEQSHTIDRNIRYKTDDTVQQVHEFSLDLKANHIYLVGEERATREALEGEEPGVEFAMANKFIKNLNIVMRHKANEPILIHMKTNGGVWKEGMAIYDAIKACPNPVTILNYTHARSMSSLIFCAADRRVMMPHSTFMLHEGETSFSGTYTQFQTEASQERTSYEQMVNIYVDTLKATGSMSKWSKQRIKEWLQENMRKHEEVYFTAEQAVKLGFADSVFGADGKYDWATLLDFS